MDHKLTIETRTNSLIGRCTGCPFYLRANVFHDVETSRRSIESAHAEAHDPQRRCNVEPSGQHRFRNPGVTGDTSCRCGEKRTIR